MTSMLAGEDSNAAKMKQKLMSTGSAVVEEEARPFLKFSRENLSISHSDLERGFDRSQLRPSRNTVLSVAALTISLLCLGLVIWNSYCCAMNTRKVEQLNRNIEALMHQFLQQDLMDELKAFEKQLYGEDSMEDDDAGETDIDNADYDSNYDDDGLASHDYSGDYHVPLTYGARPSDFPEIMSTPVPISPAPSPDSKDVLELLAAFHNEARQEFEKSLRENHKNIERERLKEEHEKGARKSHERGISDVNDTKPDDVAKDDAASTGHIESASGMTEGGVKSKRSVSDYAITTDRSTNRRHDGRSYPRSISTLSYERDESETDDNSEINSTRHPPKKYAHTRLEWSSSTTHEDQLSEEIVRLNKRTSEETGSVGGGRTSWRNAHRNTVGNRTEIRRLQVYAVHYGADSTLFSAEDQHTGNGRARHNNGIFKAWRPSDWVTELGMNRHFTLATDGKLTVHEPGLYLAYAQIHYLDEHDENGFHLLVNGRPILQCMIYSPGEGHKSRSCFSAQVTFLRAGDHLILKDVGSARYTLFQHDKSFFGLVKLGESRQQQRHQSDQSMHRSLQMS